MIPIISIGSIGFLKLVYCFFKCGSKVITKYLKLATLILKNAKKLSSSNNNSLYSCIKNWPSLFLNAITGDIQNLFWFLRLFRRWRNKSNKRTRLYRSIARAELRRFVATAMACVALLRCDDMRRRNSDVAYNALIRCDDATYRNATY